MVRVKKNGNIIKVPIEYEAICKADAIRFWQSFGSDGHYSSSPFFENFQAIRRSVKDRVNPFNAKTFTFSSDFMCSDNYLRYMHVDLAVTRDYCGIAMCHVKDWVSVEVARVVENGRVIMDRQLRPYIYFDFIGRIEKPEDGEISFSQVREIIYELDTKYGYPIQLITYDRWQSIDSIQILRDQGFIVSNLSLDRTSTYPVINVSKSNNIEKMSTGGDKYATLSAWHAYKDAVNSGRMDLPTYLLLNKKDADDQGLYTYDEGNSSYEELTWVEKEMLQAIYDADKLKVKEPIHGSIDLLEACAGATFNAINNTVYSPEETATQKSRRKITEKKGVETVFEAEEVGREDVDEESSFVDDSIFGGSDYGI